MQTIVGTLNTRREASNSSDSTKPMMPSTSATPETAGNHQLVEIHEKIFKPIPLILSTA
jgi:hypothetical protein